MLYYNDYHIVQVIHKQQQYVILFFQFISLGHLTLQPIDVTDKIMK